MKRVTLIHCYSDQNRGDSGIIEATTDLVREIEPNCEINAVSVFHENDERFKCDHYFTKDQVDKIYPSLFYEPEIKISNNKSGNFKKLAVFLKVFIKNLMFLLFPYNKVARIIFSKRQYETYQIFLDSDYIISKGGSFLYSLGGINGEFFLVRMLFNILIPVRMGKRVCIFSQSVGPFNGFISRKLFEYTLKKVDLIYLREDECKKYLKNSLSDKVSIISDSAFYLRAEERSASSGRKKVALTARPHRFSSSPEVQASEFRNYVNCLVTMAEYCISKGYEIHLVGQVTGPSITEDDRQALKPIYNRLMAKPDQRQSVKFWREEEGLMSPKALQSLYKDMDLVIGTRLHSTIFALAANTPSINISYHGTKSKGVMASVGLADFVMNIDAMDAEQGKELIDQLLLDHGIKKRLGQIVDGKRKELVESMSKFLNLPI